jgi:hypothetical protein
MVTLLDFVEEDRSRAAQPHAPISCTFFGGTLSIVRTFD